jgi:hypothetical protein
MAVRSRQKATGEREIGARENGGLNLLKRRTSG